MQLIKKLYEHIDEELCDAKKYIECAIKVKEEYPDLAKTFSDLSSQEMNHVTALHNHVEKLITAYKNENGEPPSDMLALYNYVHEKEINRAMEIKVMQQMFKE